MLWWFLFSSSQDPTGGPTYPQNVVPVHLWKYLLANWSWKQYSQRYGRQTNWTISSFCHISWFCTAWSRCQIGKIQCTCISSVSAKCYALSVYIMIMIHYGLHYRGLSSTLLCRIDYQVGAAGALSSHDHTPVSVHHSRQASDNNTWLPRPKDRLPTPSGYKGQNTSSKCSQALVKFYSLSLSDCCEMEMILAFYGFNFHLHFDFIYTHTFLCCLTTIVIKQLNSIW